MFRTTLSLLLAALLLLLAGCGGGGLAVDDPDASDPLSVIPIVSEEPEPEVVKNPLTGVEDLDPAAKDARPVAVMINNIAPAQGVQTGVGQADVVYETLVEGGITRYLAVFKDVSKLGDLGTVRSARYAYVDLALGHDAVYFHAGLDPTYCAPHLKETGIDDVDLNGGAGASYAKRMSNGLAREHTLYTSGELLSAAIKNLKRRATTDRGDWLTFCSPDSPRVPSGGVCNAVRIPLSSSYVSGFTYDSATGNYKKTQNGAAQKDFRSGEQIAFRNVFVLLTTTALYPDGYHCRVDLNSGSGYYISAGGFEAIQWSKKGPNSPLVFTAGDGSALQVNPGTSWVCIADRSASITME